MNQEKVTIDLIEQAINSAGSGSYSSVIRELQALVGRDVVIGESDRRLVSEVITRGVRSELLKPAELSEVAEPGSSGTDLNGMNNFLITTAFSADYNVGKVCSTVNEKYAAAHGYEFVSRILSLDEIAAKIDPKMHCTWFKIFLIREILKEQKEMLKEKEIGYIMWIDADAIIVNRKVPLSDIVQRAQYKDLIVGEDMHPGCLLNAGVFLLKVSEWSESFLTAVWNTEKYDDVYFYEQSAMIRCLRQGGEGLHTVQPFHSYVEGGPAGIKFFPHVAVFPSIEFNSDKGISKAEVNAYKERHGVPMGSDRSRSNSVNVNSGDVPRFIYHPAGLSDKLYFILTAIEMYGLAYSTSTINGQTVNAEGETLDYKLLRAKMGQIPTEEQMTQLLEFEQRRKVTFSVNAASAALDASFTPTPISPARKASSSEVDDKAEDAVAADTA